MTEQTPTRDTNLRAREFARIERRQGREIDHPKVRQLLRQQGDDAAAPLDRYVAMERRRED